MSRNQCPQMTQLLCMSESHYTGTVLNLATQHANPLPGSCGSMKINSRWHSCLCPLLPTALLFIFPPFYCSFLQFFLYSLKTQTPSLALKSTAVFYTFFPSSVFHTHSPVCVISSLCLLSRLSSLLCCPLSFSTFLPAALSQSICSSYFSHYRSVLALTCHFPSLCVPC